jgi:hypothetical protein
MPDFTVATKKLKAGQRAITTYYNGLPERNLAEDKERGKFSLIQFSEANIIRCLRQGESSRRENNLRNSV